MTNTADHTHQVWDEDYESKSCPTCGCVVLTVADGCRFRRNGDAHICQTSTDGGLVMRMFEERVR